MQALEQLERRFARILDEAVSKRELKRLVIAYSGGADSAALLHLAVRYAQKKDLDSACVHVDHGLTPESSSWSAHCVEFAHGLGVPIEVLAVEQKCPAGASVEAWAREQRYQLMLSALVRGDGLLTAHHEDDQAETVLARMFAGAGPHGLAGTRKYKVQGGFPVLRPLLAESRSTLQAYCTRHGLAWIEDPMNFDRRFDRAAIRHDILPAVDQFNAAARRNMARSAAIQEEIAAYLDSVCGDIFASHSRAPTQIPVSVIDAQPALLQKMLIRHLAVSNGLDVPGARHIKEALRQFCGEDAAGSGCVNWGPNQIRKYREHLYAVSARNLECRPNAQRIAPEEDVIFPGGVVRLARGGKVGLAANCLNDDDVVVRFRSGGECLRPSGRNGRHTLKKLFQEWGVPPWQRAFVPLIYIGDEIAAVADYCLCDPFVSGEEAGLSVVWESCL